MERVEAEAIFEQGRDAVVEVLLALSAQNERLAAQVEVLSARVTRQDERIAQLERRLNRSSPRAEDARLVAEAFRVGEPVAASRPAARLPGGGTP